MVLSLKYLARMAVRRLASDPRTRKKAKAVAQAFADEIQKADHDKGRAYAAGRAVRRTIKRLQENSDPTAAGRAVRRTIKRLQGNPDPT